MLNKDKLFSDFIETQLKIFDYKLEFFNVWKNNITGSIEYNNKKIILQYLNNIIPSQVKIIDKTLEICSKEWFITASKVFEKRFFEYNWWYFQIMETLEWENKLYTELSMWELKNTIKYIAKFHNMTEKYDFSEFEESTNNIKNLYCFINLSYKNLKINDKYADKFNELMWLVWKLKTSNWLRRGCIHGDIVLKNILFKNWKVTGLVDYEMIKYWDYLLDLVDHFRNYMKTPEFWKKDFFELLAAYEEIRPLNKAEKDNLEDYLKSLSLSTSFEYFLALFEWSWFSNNTTDMWTSFEKVDRWIMEYKKAESFFV